MKLSDGRDPALTWLLGAGLSVTVLSLSVAGGLPGIWMLIVWGFAMRLLLLAKKLYGSLGHNMERFGVVHGGALMAVGIALLCHHAVRFRGHL